jgi:AcrR family transcriptional regulator
MSPRPKSASDADILDGVVRAVARVGPARLALTDVAEETGLAPATLLQRFGSKREMLAAARERSAAQADRRMGEIRSRHQSPVDALVGSLVASLVATATDLAPEDHTPRALANHLAFLYADLDDAHVHRIALERARRTVAAYRALIGEAITAGELAPADPERLARGLHAAVVGSLLQWTIHRDGSLLRWVHEDAEAVLAPYRRRGAPAVAGETIPRPPTGPRARHRL